jgi:hypothetical protein
MITLVLKEKNWSVRTIGPIVLVNQSVLNCSESDLYQAAERESSTPIMFNKISMKKVFFLLHVVNEATGTSVSKGLGNPPRLRQYNLLRQIKSCFGG